MSPGAAPSRITEDLLAELGFTYTLDWPIDDQPVWLSTRGGPLLAVPYPHEVNDLPVFVHHHHTAETFASMITDSFDELRENSTRQPLVLSISLHTFLAGQPHRLRRVRSALEPPARPRRRRLVHHAGRHRRPLRVGGARVVR